MDFSLKSNNPTPTGGGKNSVFEQGFTILAISSGLYIQLFMRSPIFGSEMSSSGAWRPK